MPSRMRSASCDRRLVISPTPIRSKKATFCRRIDSKYFLPLISSAYLVPSDSASDPFSCDNPENRRKIHRHHCPQSDINEHQNQSHHLTVEFILRSNCAEVQRILHYKSTKHIRQISRNHGRQWEGST